MIPSYVRGLLAPARLAEMGHAWPVIGPVRPVAPNRAASVGAP